MYIDIDIYLSTIAKIINQHSILTKLHKIHAITKDSTRYIYHDTTVTLLVRVSFLIAVSSCL